MTKAIEHHGRVIEVTDNGGAYFATIDGDEIDRSFPNAAVALDYAKRQVTLAVRRDARADEPAHIVVTHNYMDETTRDFGKRMAARYDSYESEFGITINRVPCTHCVDGERDDGSACPWCWALGWIASEDVLDEGDHAVVDAGIAAIAELLDSGDLTPDEVTPPDPNATILGVNRDEGTVVLFDALTDTDDLVVLAVDHRLALDLVRALQRNEDPRVAYEAWQVVG